MLHNIDDLIEDNFKSSLLKHPAQALALLGSIYRQQRSLYLHPTRPPPLASPPISLIIRRLGQTQAFPSSTLLALFKGPVFDTVLVSHSLSKRVLPSTRPA